MNIRGALADRILNNAPLVALLDTYGSTPEPAVFSPVAPTNYVPKVAPHVLIRRPTAVNDESAFKGRLSSAIISIVAYGMLPKNSTDDSAVTTVSDALRELFRSKSFVFEGVTYQAIVTGPIPAPTETENLVGELVQVQLTVGD